MRKFDLFFIFLLFGIKEINSQIKNNPFFLDNNKYPLLLNTNDDNYFYVIFSGKNLQIEKESGKIINTMNNVIYSSDFIHIFDNNNNNYLYYSNKYYLITYPTIAFEEFAVNSRLKSGNYQLINVGSIPQNDGFIIYGYYTNHLFFLSNSQEYISSIEINDISDKISCKFISGEDYICAMIIDAKLQILCFKYHINQNDSSQDYLALYENKETYNSISSFGLYDTNENSKKLLCQQNNQNIQCEFFEVKIINNEANFFALSLSSIQNIFFTTSNDFTEKNCYLSLFNSEYLFCCAIKDYIKCYRINSNNYEIIKEFNLPISGDNYYLTIKSSNDFVTLFFMNDYNNIKSVYEYYFYLPTCENKNYVIINSLNENKPVEEKEKLSNLFTIKTNKYYFELNNQIDEFGYFSLNNERLNKKTLINNNNDYILDFIVTNNNILETITKTVDYTVSVEDEAAYSKECQITLTFNSCYHSCEKCSKNINDSNEEQHNCLKCKGNYYPSPENNNNCYSLEEKKDNWYFDSTKSVFCFNELNNNKCAYKLTDSRRILTDSNNVIKDIIDDLDIDLNPNISGINDEFKIHIDTISIENTTNQKYQPEPSIELGNCERIIKEYYNISEEEPLFIVKKDIIVNNQIDGSSNNGDKSFNSAKKFEYEIYAKVNSSLKKLNLSVCKEEVTLNINISEFENIDFNFAKDFAAQGIDVFNREDKFYNDICYYFNNTMKKDTSITDRINIYNNFSLCQDGCTFKEINLTDNVAQCSCPTIYLEENVGKVIMKAIGDSLKENLFRFNFNVIKCYNLVLNKKILVHNIGFYCLSSMFIIQIILTFVFMKNKLNSLKDFMQKFELKNTNDKKAKTSNYINNKENFQNDNNNENGNTIKKAPPRKRRNKSKSSRQANDNNHNMVINNKIKHNIKESNNDNKYKNKINLDNFDLEDIPKNQNHINILKRKSFSKSKINSTRSLLFSNKLDKDNNNKNILEEKGNLSKNTKGIETNKTKGINFININNNISIYNIEEKIEQSIKNDTSIENKIIKDSMQLLKSPHDLQDIDYEEAIINDKRKYLRIYWDYLLDSQIILSTFWTDNHFDLLVIKLNFLVFTFQINFFLNALFYTDDYISDAYNNDGILEFISGLPKAIYSFIATLIITSLLRLLSSSKEELMKVIKEKRNCENYFYFIQQKLAKLRIKLIIYFILVYSLSLFFLYYVTAFCAVYKYSQKYWIHGWLETFALDTLESIIVCIFLALIRYYSIKNNKKCLYKFGNILSNFF